MTKTQKPRKLTNEAISHEPEITQKDIAYRQFKKQLRGYNIDEVDEFLNAIARDYAWFEQHFTNMSNELSILKQSKPAGKEIKFDDLTPELQQSIKRADNLYKYIKARKKN